MRRTGRRDASRLHGLLEAHGATLATAESLTGGRLAALLTETPGASRTYLGGVVGYATEVKVAVLGVPQDLVSAHGVVSAECARAMARGIRGLTGATYSLSTTGVAGPDAQEGHPPGTVYVGVAGPELDRVLALELYGDRSRIQEATCETAVAALIEILEREDSSVR